MSEQQQNGQRRNHKGNGNNRNRNRNNNNRNRNNNRNQNGKRGPRKHTPKPLKLTLWQKFLKKIGCLNEAKLRKQQELARHRAPKAKSTTSPNNTRVAKPRKAPEKIAVETPRLYVGNLSYDASETDIEDLFKGIGSVKKVEVIYNRHTHRSKGYGFVQMLSVDDAKRAVDVLHDQPFLGRNLIVNGSKARNPSDPSANTDNADNSGDSDAA